MNLCKNYGLNLNSFKAEFKDCSDFLLREVVIGGKRAFFMAMDGLIDSLQLNRMIIAPVLNCKLEESAEKSFETIKNSVVGAIEMSVVYTFEECEFYVMSGFAVFMIEGCGKALVMAAQGWSRRTTDEPTNEAMVKGAKECFVETLNDNKALLRKRLKTPHLKLKQLRLGTAAQTPVVLAYIDNRAKKGFVEEIEKRLEKAELNTVLDYGCLEPYIGSDVKSVFSAVGNTERPDVLASKLLEGRVGVMVEGTP
ncbi:MAG: spore germination protein, partial [Eubacterium sp.]|nr:spore germination protein [Eubacterium sp.]